MGISGRCARVVARWVFILAMGLFVAGVRGAPPAGSSLATGAQGVGGVSHAWVVTPGPNDVGAMIWHVPSRGGELVKGWRPGTARLVGDLPQMPEAIAAVENRLYMVFEDRPSMPPPRPREVLSLAAVATNGGDQWVTRPQGRYDVSAALRSEGRLLSCIGSNGAVWALMHGLRDPGDDARAVVLLRLGAGGWVSVPLPPTLSEFAIKSTVTSGNKVAMPLVWKLFATSGGGGGVGLAVCRGTDAGEEVLEAWKCGLPPAVSGAGVGSDAGASPSWARLRLEWPEDATPPLKHLQLVYTGDELAAVYEKDGATRLLSGMQRFAAGERADEEAAASIELRPVTQLLQGSEQVAVAALDNIGGLLLIGSSAPDKTEKPPASVAGAVGGGRKMVEVSLRTGRVMSDGSLTPQSPMSAADYRLVGLLIFVIVATVGVFIARPPKDAGEVHLPEDCGMTDPGRRVIASLIDLVIACVVGTSIWKEPLRSMVRAEWWGSESSLAVIATVVALLVLIGTVCEALFGKSPGKLFMGCEVVSIIGIGVKPTEPQRDSEILDSDSLHRPSLANSFVRNVIKWLTLPAAAVGLLDLSRRHRGDQWGKAAVIERYVEVEGEEE